LSSKKSTPESPLPMGRDTDLTVEMWETVVQGIKPAGSLFRGPIPRQSPGLRLYRNPRLRAQVTGICVGESGAAMFETTVRTPEPFKEGAEPRPSYNFSPLWIYQVARKKTRELGGRLMGDGAVVSHALMAVQEEGVIALFHWPCNAQTERAYRDNVTPASARNARKHKPFGDSRRLTDSDQILEYLAAGYSAWVGVPWRGGFRTAADGRFSWGGMGAGGHAVELLDYDLDKDRLWVGNSWAQWGVNNIGYCSLKSFFGEFSSGALSSGRAEACVVTEVEGDWRVKVQPFEGKAA
jgi:hypothetical protein